MVCWGEGCRLVRMDVVCGALWETTGALGVDSGLGLTLFFLG